jgi:hypothetical protein
MGFSPFLPIEDKIYFLDNFAPLAARRDDKSNMRIRLYAKEKNGLMKDKIQKIIYRSE